MPCTTILVGKNASYDGSTMIARNDDSGAGAYTAKKFVIVHPKDQPETYTTKISHLTMTLPDNPLRYSCVPNADIEKEGIWAASGINACNVAMTATETITSNPRVLGADPLVKYEKETKTKPRKIGGLGEEDLVTVTLPYIRSAREGVERLGALLAKYGTYESNGIAFSDVNEIWWLETIGGHHWIAKRVPDEGVVIMPNQLGIDNFDLRDALTTKKNHMCSEDLERFMKHNHLDLSLNKKLNPRDTFGSNADSDHVYNTPRAWFMGRYLNPTAFKWDGPDADFHPESDNIPWCFTPERKITPEDVKYLLSSHFQGTPYDPYGSYGDPALRGKYRSIGINRNDFLALLQLRPYAPEDSMAIQWLAFASNAFNALVPFYANVNETPEYLSNTTEDASTDNFYWSNRLIAALADASYKKSVTHVERYEKELMSKGHELIAKGDKELKKTAYREDLEKAMNLREKANHKIAETAKTMTQNLLNKVLYEASNQMKNAYARSDN